MIGTTINNKDIIDLIDAGLLVISPFDRANLQIAHYPLRPRIVWEVTSSKSGQIVRDFTVDSNSFMLKPHTYYWVDIYENIRVPKGIIGEFKPASVLIEKGINLIYGKVEFPYGEKGERIRFGMYNFLTEPVALDFAERIAYVTFTDLRGLDNAHYLPTQYDEKIYEFRREMDDGPNYEKYND